MAENLTSLLRKLYNDDRDQSVGRHLKKMHKLKVRKVSRIKKPSMRNYYTSNLSCVTISNQEIIRSQMDQGHRIFSQKATKLNQNHKIIDLGKFYHHPIVFNHVDLIQ